MLKKRYVTLRDPSRPTLSREAAIFTAETLWRKTAAWICNVDNVWLLIFNIANLKFGQLQFRKIKLLLQNLHEIIYKADSTDIENATAHIHTDRYLLCTS